MYRPCAACIEYGGMTYNVYMCTFRYVNTHVYIYIHIY